MTLVKNYITKILMEKGKGFRYFSLTLDDGNDIADIAQVFIFIIYFI